MSTDARLKCKRCTGTDVVNIQGCDLCRQAKVTSRCRVMEHLRHPPPHASDCGATLPATQGGTLSQRNKSVWAGTRGAPCLLGLGGSPCRCAQLCSIPRPQTQARCSITPRCWPVLQRSAGRYIDLVAGEPFGIHHGCLSKPIYEAKYTTLNPIQLPTTPSAEYALVNINGRNS